MRGKYHLIVTMIFFLVIYLIFGVILEKHYITITVILTGVIFSFFPDIDQNFPIIGHRNIITHSIIFTLITYLLHPHFIFLLFNLAVGFHCLCDCRVRRSKMRGYYTIKLMKGRGLDGKWSTIWLLGNFIVSFGIFLGVVILN